VRRPSELPGGPLSLFSPGARDMVRCALEEAQRLDHGSIGTEHLLLALIQDDQGAAGRVLSDLHVRLAEARARVEHIVPRGEEHHIAGSAAGQIGFTPAVTRIFSQALREMAVRDHATEIDTGDILLAIEQDGEGVAVQVLEQLGALPAVVRVRTLGALRGDATPVPAGGLTPSARRALLLADAEATALGHTWVGCEHLLLALTRQDGPASGALGQLEVTAETVHSGLIDLGGSVAFGDPVRTPRLIRSIETAEQIAGAAGRAQADDGDLVLGLARESTGLARELLGPEATEQALRAALGR
jgi:ATP-dependent Clp protease ATP-binding subunit ClpA